jgi:hypothetical protein
VGSKLGGAGRGGWRWKRQGPAIVCAPEARIACFHRIFTGRTGRNSGKSGSVDGLVRPAAAIGEIAAAAPALAIDSGVVKRTVSALLSFVALMLVAAPAAMADNGVGLAGPTTDKTVTFFCFGVMAFFVILVIVLSAIQGKLEKRKERRRYDLERLS